MTIDDNDITKLKTIFATKDDLKRFATKDDLNRFATKDDLKRFVTKADLKKALANYPTKDEAKKTAQDVVEQLAIIINESIAKPLTELQQRVTRLENRGVLPPLA